MFTLSSRVLTAHILTRGATLAGLWHTDIPHSLVLGSSDTQVFTKELLYAGSIVGPIGNRVGAARVRIGATEWDLPANEGHTCLHGGANGIFNQNWQVETQTQSRLVLRLDLKHGDMGLPGNRRLCADYSVDDTGVLTLALRASSDADTLINLVHHPYWTLDNHPTVAQHRLRVDADHYLPINDNSLPTGSIAPVQDTPFDFRTTRPVPTNVRLDHNFCLAQERAPTPVHRVDLMGQTGTLLRISTTEPGLQVYNGFMLPDAPVLLHDGQALGPYAGIALEPQAWPDAPNNTHFPSILLAAGQEYIQHTAYSISL